MHIADSWTLVNSWSWVFTLWLESAKHNGWRKEWSHLSQTYRFWSDLNIQEGRRTHFWKIQQWCKRYKKLYEYQGSTWTITFKTRWLGITLLCDIFNSCTSSLGWRIRPGDDKNEEIICQRKVLGGQTSRNFWKIRKLYFQSWIQWRGKARIFACCFNVAWF